MINQYPGKCYRCGCTVDAGAGHFERFGHRWALKHVDCDLAIVASRVRAAKISIGKLNTLLSDPENF